MSREPVPAPGAVTNWAGWVAVVGFMLCLAGCFTVAQGAMGVLRRWFDIGGPRPGSGWGLILVGLALVASGWGVLAGRWWARGIAVVLAAADAAVSLALLEVYPVWMTVTVCLDAAVIYALVAHGRDLRVSRG